MHARAALVGRIVHAGTTPALSGVRPKVVIPFEDLDVQIDPARCHQVAVKLGHLPCMRCEARSNGGDADAIDREIVVAIEAGCRITNPRGGEHQIVGGDMIEEFFNPGLPP